MGRRARPIERAVDGFACNVDRDERDLLLRLLGELRNLLTVDPASDALTRIFPPAYHLPDDAAANAEYSRLMREELVTSRLAGIAIVEAALAGDGDRLDERQVLALMQAVNGIRLVLGTILHVDEETGAEDLDGDDPHAAEYHLYDYLSWLLDSGVQALSTTA
jgi:hypothetical protein